LRGRHRFQALEVNNVLKQVAEIPLFEFLPFPGRSAIRRTILKVFAGLNRPGAQRSDQIQPLHRICQVFS
jgi:hypothetical protein